MNGGRRRRQSRVARSARCGVATRRIISATQARQRRIGAEDEKRAKQGKRYTAMRRTWRQSAHRAPTLGWAKHRGVADRRRVARRRGDRRYRRHEKHRLRRCDERCGSVAPLLWRRRRRRRRDMCWVRRQTLAVIGVADQAGDNGGGGAAWRRWRGGGQASGEYPQAGAGRRTSHIRQDIEK